MLSRYEPDGIIDIRDESASPTYQNLVENALDTNSYYELWFVISHSDNQYDLYIKGGSQYATETLIYENALYRNQTFDNLINFFLQTSAGNTTDGAKGAGPCLFR